MMLTIRSASAIAFLAVVLLSGSAHAQVPPEPPAAAQVRAGDMLMTQGQYAEAARQYETAYAIDPDIAILERLANAYRLSGDVGRAAQIDARIAQQRGQAAPYPPPAMPPPPPTYYQPQPTYVAPSPLPGPAYTYTRPAPQRRAGQSLLNAGLGLLIAGYGVALVGGAITMSAAYSVGADSSWYGAGGMLMIPIAGPFATMAYNSDFYWAAPWAVISGGLQLSGLALTIAGAVVRAKHPNSIPVRTAKSFPVALSPYAGPNGSGLVVAGVF